MKKFFFLLVITFGILFVANITWIVLNLYSWATVGIDIVLSDNEFRTRENKIFNNLQETKKEKINKSKIDTSGI